MEKQINGYKAREKDFKERIKEKTMEIEKIEKTNQSLKNAIQKLDKKIEIAAKLTASGNKKSK